MSLKWGCSLTHHSFPHTQLVLIFFLPFHPPMFLDVGHFALCSHSRPLVFSSNLLFFSLSCSCYIPIWFGQKNALLPQKTKKTVPLLYSFHRPAITSVPGCTWILPDTWCLWCLFCPSWLPPFIVAETARYQCQLMWKYEYKLRSR